MLTDEVVSRRDGFRRPSGMSRSAFDELFGDFQAAERERLGRLTRRPAASGGMADKAYATPRGEYPGLVTPEPARRGRPLSDEQKAADRVVAAHRVVVEHATAQMNRHEALRQTWRGSHARHNRPVRVAAVLVNRRTEATPLKRYPAPARGDERHWVLLRKRSIDD